MQVNIQQIIGNWDLGFSLDKHVMRSIPIGFNEYGYLQYDTIRTEIGEALFQLKYRADFKQISLIAQQLNELIVQKFAYLDSIDSIDLMIPMPPSKHRAKQPVIEIVKYLSQISNIPYRDDLLLKMLATPSMKDISSKEEKINASI